jgi:YbbR domain-containing protein
MDKLWKSNLIYKALAVLLAILLWFYVNPYIEKVITVSVAYQNMKEGLVVVSEPQKVDVKVRGTSSVIDTLSSEEIKAYVKLDTAKIGEGSFLVEAAIPPEVVPVSIKPSYLNLELDEIKEKQLSVRVITQGIVAAGYSNFEPVLEPSTVVVSGASQLLTDLDTALITVNLDQAKDNLVLNPPVTLLTKDGDIVTDKFEVSPKNIQVFIPVTENTHNKTVSITPNIKGEPHEGYRVSRVVLDPETVKITGSYDVLSLIYQVNTAPIDITGITENYATQVALVPPEGANLLYEPVVKVLVQIEASTVTKVLEDVPVSVVNLAEGKQAVLSPNKVSMTLKGPKEQITALSKIAVKASVDVAELESGLHKLEVKAEIPNELQLIKIEPSTVEVSINEKDKNPED